MGPVTVEIYEIDYRQKSKKQKKSIREFVRILMQKNQLTGIWIDFFPSIRFLIANPKKEVKPVVTEKNRFDDRDHSFLK